MCLAILMVRKEGATAKPVAEGFEGKSIFASKQAAKAQGYEVHGIYGSAEWIEKEKTFQACAN